LPDGLHLDFLTAADGLYLPVTLDGSTLGTLLVPMTGLSTGDAMVVFFTTTHGTVLGVSHDDGRSFATAAGFPGAALPGGGASTNANVVPRVVATSDVGLGARWASPRTVLMFARKKSDAIMLLAAPLDSLLTPSKWAFFGGFDAGGRPIWTTAGAGRPVVEASADDRHGHFSVTPLPRLGVWVMLTRCATRALEYRVAPSPLGPWSAPRIFFDKIADGGTCHYMHRACAPADGLPCCDADVQPVVPDPRGCPHWGKAEDSYPYAPFVLEPWLRWDAASRTLVVYFLMSVFNPYSPMVMMTTIVDDDLR